MHETITLTQLNLQTIFEQYLNWFTPSEQKSADQ